MKEGNSESVEMYLKTVAELGGETQPVSIARVAERLGISPVSANEMMKRLGESRYIDHLPYKGVTLTDQGRRLANSVIRRQRLWECFLVGRLGIEWAEAYEIACDLEHATSPQVTEALAAFLGHPTVCPHGNGIPDPAGLLNPAPTTSLAKLKIGESARVRAVTPENGDVLAYFAERGLLPGCWITVMEVAPLDGPLTLQISDSPDETGFGQQVTLGINLAQLLMVEVVLEKKAQVSDA